MFNRITNKDLWFIAERVQYCARGDNNIFIVLRDEKEIKHVTGDPAVIRSDCHDQ